MPFQSRNIVLIGTGNVAHQIGRALKYSGNRVVMLIGRDREMTESLAFELGCPWSSDPTEIPEETDVVLIAVSDDAIAKVASQLFCPGKVVAHTSGSVPMEALGDCSDRLGVFYPLQTMHRDTALDMRKVPFCIEGNSNWNEGALTELACSISDSVQLIDSDQRRILHLAAVFACNFANHCYAMADDILTKAQIPMELLHPLIAHTAENIRNGRPHQLQTGPAKRGDREVMERQMAFLRSEHPGLVAFYEAMSEGIVKRSGR